MFGPGRLAGPDVQLFAWLCEYSRSECRGIKSHDCDYGTACGRCAASKRSISSLCVLVPSCQHNIGRNRSQKNRENALPGALHSHLCYGSFCNLMRRSWSEQRINAAGWRNTTRKLHCDNRGDLRVDSALGFDPPHGSVNNGVANAAHAGLLASDTGCPGV